MHQLQIVALGDLGPQGQQSSGNAMLEATRAQCPEASSPSLVQSLDSQSPARGSKLLGAAECSVCLLVSVKKNSGCSLFYSTRWQKFAGLAPVARHCRAWISSGARSAPQAGTL